MKKLLLIPLFALLTWGGVKLYDRLRPPTVSEMIREIHESLPKEAQLTLLKPPVDLPIVITPTPPDVHVTWPQQPVEKPRAHHRRRPTPLPTPKPQELVEAQAAPVVYPRCLFWYIGEFGCIPQ